MPVLLVAQFEVGILNYAEHISERILYCCHLDTTADVLNVFMPGCTQLNHPVQSFFGIFDTPVGNDTFTFLSRSVLAREQTKLVATDIKTYVEWLIKIRLDAQYGVVPALRFVDIINVINCRTQT